MFGITNPCKAIQEAGYQMIKSETASTVLKTVGLLAVSAFSFKLAAGLLGVHLAYQTIPGMYTKYRIEEASLQRRKGYEQEQAAAQAAREATAAADAAKTPQQAVEEARQGALSETEQTKHAAINASYDMILCDPECEREGKNLRWVLSKFSQYHKEYKRNPKLFNAKLAVRKFLKNVV